MLINNKPYRAVWFEDGRVKLIDQTLLPYKFQIVAFDDYHEVAAAIKKMTIRGAPSIGATAAFGMALAARQKVNLEEAAQVFKSTRPTAQDLFYGVNSVLHADLAGIDPLQAANEVADRYVRACEKIGEYGEALIKDGCRVNTHCNAGWLAAVDWGTALAPIYKAHRNGKNVFVYVDETRPRCQGGKQTAYELGEEGIPHAVIADNATGFYMHNGEIDMVIVGTDRVAVNGDIANKIGTYSSAVVAKENNIPFYVAAPFATIDRNCPSGDAIPIEEREDAEVTCMFGYDPAQDKMVEVRIAPERSRAKNPGFDVTPAKYITGIITEKGIFKPEEIGKAVG